MLLISYFSFVSQNFQRNLSKLTVHCYVSSMFDCQSSLLYVIMERGEMDLASFFRASKTCPDVSRRFINPCWVQMLHAVQALHQQGNVPSFPHSNASGSVHSVPHTHARTHAHTHTFNGPFSGTTQVSRYQKGKTNVDFTEATDSEW